MPLRSREINDKLSEARIEQLFQSRLRKEIRRALAGVEDDLLLYLLIDGTRALGGFERYSADQ
jgi:hypothetical protein